MLVNCSTSDRKINVKTLTDKFIDRVCATDADGSQIYLRVREYCRDQFLSHDDLEKVKNEFESIYGVKRPSYQLRPLLVIVCDENSKSKRRLFAESIFGRTEEDFSSSNELIKVSSSEVRF